MLHGLGRKWTVSRELELTVVMPCLNEERSVGICVEKARSTMERLGVVGEVLIVDNGSTDRSVEVAESLGARVVHHGLRGYGNALRRGFAEAQGRYIIMADCDDSYDLTDLGRFLDELRLGTELVMGNRLKGEIKPGAMKWLHRWVGNPILTWFLNVLFDSGIGDTHCGMRGFTKEAISRLNLKMPGMELASEMVIKSSLARLKTVEIPITLWPDKRGRPPHLRSFRDGWRHLRFMLMCSPGALFVVPGAVLLLVGLASIPALMLAGFGQFTRVFGPNFMFTAAMVALTGYQLLIFGLMAKLHSHQIDAVFRDPLIERFSRGFSVDRGLLLGGALILAGLVVGLPTLSEWLVHGSVSKPGAWILALALGSIGIETVFASFVVGVFELSSESRRSG